MGRVAVEAKALKLALKDVSAAIESRSTIPILANVLLRCAPGSMTLVGTDMDLMVERHLDLENPHENTSMTVTVPSATLEKIVAKLPADGVAVLKQDVGKITVSCGRARFVLPTLGAEEFPILPGGDWDCQFEVEGSALEALLDAVQFAMSTEETRYYLNGIYLHAPDAALIAAATDGSRLARSYMDKPEDAADLPGAIVGRKTVKILDTLLADHNAQVTVSLSKGKVQFEIGTTTVTAKLIDGTFPDYTRVIPTANDKAIWFDPQVLAQAVDRVITISSEKTRLVKLSFVKNLLTLQVTSPENGVATEEMEVTYDGDDITIGFNGAYMLDVLRHLKADTAQLLLADPAAPSLWRDAEDAARIYVLMPMRV